MKAYILKDVPQTTWNKFKALCALKGISIKTMLTAMIQREIEKEEKSWD